MLTQVNFLANWDKFHVFASKKKKKEAYWEEEEEKKKRFFFKIRLENVQAPPFVFNQKENLSNETICSFIKDNLSFFCSFLCWFWAFKLASFNFLFDPPLDFWAQIEKQ